MIPSPRGLTTDEAAPSRVQWFCNNCFKPSDTPLVADGQFPVCGGCLERRRENRSLST